VGKAKGKGSACLDYKKERRNYRCRKKEAFAAYESTLGGEEKSKRKEVNSAQQVFSQPWAARGERSGLQTRTAATESVLLCTRLKC